MTGFLKSITVTGRRSATASIAERATNAMTQRALQKATAKIPVGMRKHLPLARSLITGGPAGLIDAGLNELFERFGINGTLLPGVGMTGESELLGGITPADARRIFDQHSALGLAKKNLWCIRARNLNGDDPLDINMFALDVSYPGFSVQGEPVLVGSGSFDIVTNSERREMRVTTLDDAAGSVKKWFHGLHSKMCRPDGTFGLPVDYLFCVDVLHAYISEESNGALDGYTDSFIMRPGAMDNDLSRREDGMTEVQMTFVQWDTSASLVG